MKKLTMRRQRFKDLYLTYFNATRAAREAGFANPGRYGSALLKEPDIKEAIEEALAEVHMGKDEVLARLADIARGDVGEFLTVEKDGTVSLDLSAAKKNTKLIKRIKKKKVVYNGKNYDTETNIEDIELYSALDALEKISRVHGLFKDQLEIKGNLTWKEFINGDDSNTDPETDNSES